MITLLVEPNLPPRLVDVSMDDMKDALGWIEITHPFEDDDVVLINDEDGIRNGREPNRTVNGCIIPGPFFICRFDAAEELSNLTPADIATYSDMFKTPEQFGPGQWKITSYVEERPNVGIVHMVSAWITETGGGKK